VSGVAGEEVDICGLGAGDFDPEVPQRRLIKVITTMMATAITCVDRDCKSNLAFAGAFSEPSMPDFATVYEVTVPAL
jgi:hypothetical protein